MIKIALVIITIIVKLFYAIQLLQELKYFFTNQKIKEKNKSYNSKKENKIKLNPNNINDAYRILGVNKDSKLKECKRSYRNLMSVYHPDKTIRLRKNEKKQAQEKAKLINLAWEKIKKNV